MPPEKTFLFFQLLPTLSLVANVMLPMDFSNRYPAGERRDRALRLLEQVITPMPQGTGFSGHQGQRPSYVLTARSGPVSGPQQEDVPRRVHVPVSDVAAMTGVHAITQRLGDDGRGTAAQALSVHVLTMTTHQRGVLREECRETLREMCEAVCEDVGMPLTYFNSCASSCLVHP